MFDKTDLDRLMAEVVPALPVTLSTLAGMRLRAEIGAYEDDPCWREPVGSANGRVCR